MQAKRTWAHCWAVLVASGICLTLLGCGTLGPFGADRPGAAFYVASDGCSENAGTRRATFGSLESARDAIRALKQVGPLPGPVTVWVRGGVHRRYETFELTEEDSGTPDAPIVYGAYPGEEARLIGGDTLAPAWFRPIQDPALLARLEADARPHVMQIDLRAHGIVDYGELGAKNGGMGLFCGDLRMPLARWPNVGESYAGWAEARSANTVGVEEEVALKLRDERQLQNVMGIRFEGDPPNAWQDLDQVWVRGIWQQEYVYDGWHPVAFDAQKRLLTMPFTAYPHMWDWRRFYVANAFEEIDRPGEWFLDRDEGTLYFWPPEETSSTGDSTATPIMASILQDTMVSMSNVSHVTLRDLTFEVMRGQAIWMGGGTGNRIEDCTIRHAVRAIDVSGGTEHTVAGCHIYDLEASGVCIEGGDRKALTPGKHSVVNNHIHHYGQLLMTWQPGVRVKGVGHRVAHNDIHHAPQYAVSYEGNDHVFEFNDMHDVCLEMSDVGVIGCGTDWTYRGNVIRYNYIHDIPRRPYPGVVGVYFDNCASSAEVFANVFYNLDKPIVIGGGRDHIIHNNIFIECECPIYMDNLGLRWGHFQPGGPMYKLLDDVGHDAPPWSERYPKLARILDEQPQAPLGNVVVRNLSVRSGWRNPEEACRKMFGNNIDTPYVEFHDNYATDDDPGFIDYGAKDWRLREDSVAFQKIPGFEPVPFERIGRYKAGEGVDGVVDRGP